MKIPKIAGSMQSFGEMGEEAVKKEKPLVGGKFPN
jgi:hypothetical protein